MKVTRKKAIDVASKELSSAGIKNSRYEAELLLSSLINISRVDIYKEPDAPIPEKLHFQFLHNVAKRIARIPLQYILGKVEFMGLDFYVNRHTFIPRPETELLVEEALYLIKQFKRNPVKILDIGTGCGNIAISIAKLFPNSLVTATEISKKALSVAKENALKHNVADKISFLYADLFPGYNCKFDIIISNPPYVAWTEAKKVQQEVLFEPIQAVWGGYDGLDFITRILSGSYKYLNDNGYVILEIGWLHSKKIESMMESLPNLNLLGFKKDYSRIKRIAVFQTKSNIPE